MWRITLLFCEEQHVTDGCGTVNYVCIVGGFTYQWENFKAVFLKSTLYFLVAFVFLITKI